MESKATTNTIAAETTENPHGFNAETLEAMKDAAEGKNLSGPFMNVDELFASLEEN